MGDFLLSTVKVSGNGTVDKLRAEGYAPSVDQWERMVNTFYRLIPLNNEYENYFENLNSRENLDREGLNII